MACPNGSDIRRWVGVIAQRRKTGLSDAAAYDQAWRIITEVNPFPSVLGRICPHPCEAGCNRATFDEPLAIHSMERFLGDWAIDRELPLRRLTHKRLTEKIGVVGAGPSGLSFAYQMARRGYRVTVYDGNEAPGGMLRFGIPSYRLPKYILDAEIDRIEKLGVDIRPSLKIGRDITLDNLRSRYSAVYVALGAGQGRLLEIPGEQGRAVRTGVEFLLAASRGQRFDLGKTTLVLGGGSTAVDAARTARRFGSKAVIAYRRTRREMPAAKEEIQDALDEGVELLPLVQVIQLERDDAGSLVAAVTRRMRLGGPDSSGRKRPIPLAGSEERLPVDSVILAISQHPDLEGFDEVASRGDWLLERDPSDAGAEVLAGGDVTGLGIAGNAIVQGRLAAEALHERFQGTRPFPREAPTRIMESGRVKFESRGFVSRAVGKKLGVAERFVSRDAEVAGGITRRQFLDEAERCASCGSCFGCGQCAMFCTTGCYEELPHGFHGNYFELSRDRCHECGKCVEVCPSGFLEMADVEP